MSIDLAYDFIFIQFTAKAEMTVLLSVQSFPLAMYQIPVPLSHCGNDRRKTGLGSSTCGTSWREWYRIFMGTVYGRRADQCHSWYCAAADPDPDDHGSFEQSEDCSL